MQHILRYFSSHTHHPAPASATPRPLPAASPSTVTQKTEASPRRKTQPNARQQATLIGQQKKQEAIAFLAMMTVAADTFERVAAEAVEAIERADAGTREINPPREADGVTIGVMKNIGAIPPGVRNAIAKKIDNAPFPPLKPGRRSTSCDAYLKGLIDRVALQGETLLIALDYFDRLQDKLSALSAFPVIDSPEQAGAAPRLSSRDVFLRKILLSSIILAHKYQHDEGSYSGASWATVAKAAARGDRDAAGASVFSQKEISQMQAEVWAQLDHDCRVEPARFKQHIAALEKDLLR